MHHVLVHGEKLQLPKGYSFGKFVDHTGEVVEEVGIWYSYDSDCRNFHIVPDDSRVCEEMRGILYSIVFDKLDKLKDKRFKKRYCSAQTESPEEPWRENHKYAWINSDDGFQYLISFNRLVNTDGVISNHFGLAQFMRYHNNINCWSKMKSGFVLYPHDADDNSVCVNGKSGHIVYNAPFTIESGSDEIAEHFYKFIKGEVIPFPPVNL